MSEKGGGGKETHKSPEQNEDAESAIERARKSLEKEHKPKDGETADDIRHEVEKHAESGSAEKSSKRAEKGSQEAISVGDKKKSYSQTMRRVRSRLNPVSRSFSKVIHAPVVEQASEVVGKTVARPSGIIGGSTAAIIGMAIVLFYSRRHGFELSGSEFILLMLGGFILGLLFEFIGRIFKRR